MKNLINHNKSILIAAAMLASLSGCALTPVNIDLAYQPQQGVVQIPEASKVTVAVQVTDDRMDKSRVGSKTNGYGAELAAIQTNEDVTVTVKHAIEQELQDRGFHFGTDATVNIAVDMTKFTSKFKPGFWSVEASADLNMDVTVKTKQGGTLYSKQLTAKDALPKEAMFMGGDNTKIMLDKALANAMKTLFNDKAFIAALLASTTAN